MAEPLNLLHLSQLPSGGQELFETLLKRPGIEIERIVSTGQTTASGQWYDQSWDEWILLLQGQAEIAYQVGERVQLQAGDSLMIPAHQRHRVTRTSQVPPCIWLALHLK